MALVERAICLDTQSPVGVKRRHIHNGRESEAFTGLRFKLRCLLAGNGGRLFIRTTPFGPQSWLVIILDIIEPGGICKGSIFVSGFATADLLYRLIGSISITEAIPWIFACPSATLINPSKHGGIKPLLGVVMVLVPCSPDGLTHETILKLEFGSLNVFSRRIYE